MVGYNSPRFDERNLEDGCIVNIIPSNVSINSMIDYFDIRCDMPHYAKSIWEPEIGIKWDKKNKNRPIAYVLGSHSLIYQSRSLII